MGLSLSLELQIRPQKTGLDLGGLCPSARLALHSITGAGTSLLHPKPGLESPLDLSCWLMVPLILPASWICQAPRSFCSWGMGGG